MAAVGDAGQAVGEALRAQHHGLLAQQLLARHRDAHIADLDQAVAWRAFHRDRRHLHRLLDALLAQVQRERRLVQRLRQQRREVVVQRVLDGRVHASAAQLRTHREEILPHHLLVPQAGVPAHPRIPQRDAALAIEHDGAEVHGGEHAFQQGQARDVVQRRDGQHEGDVAMNLVLLQHEVDVQHQHGGAGLAAGAGGAGGAENLVAGAHVIPRQ
ncbi:conserved hypothetical protein [Ricinus communis]|uniref:Uncharacterized protein n=1 Tax=Ricinus communis TaxID=3988 RepID=B9TJ31_RICCO|nr:conserved hypothetical protein [Ricinus communis]